MTLELHVDGERWRRHLRSFAETVPGLVPVIKGNGYGFTPGRLARRAQWLHDQGLGVDTVAVGTYGELGEVQQRFDGDLLVLTPWRPFGPALEVDPALRDRVVHTVSRLADLEDLLDREPRARFVLELVTSMLRHGMTGRELRAAGRLLAGRPGHRLAGVAVHLPLNTGSHVAETERLLTDVVAADLPAGGRTIWVSHLSPAELTTLRSAYADFTWRSRTGTALWLGDRDALRVTSRVLDVHPVRRGDVFGYRHRSIPRAGHLLVVSGGTAHGIGLEAPAGDLSLRARAATVARGGLDALGLVRSPFSVGGTPRLFAEPPHMQASMLFLPGGAEVPAVGDFVDVRVRYTATTFDRVVVS